ncbi:FISUMP domain-containing protein [Bacteroides sp.]|uniref:FISUMP domain-containing protein n=1 Tax=Bacteroides sp. TaxID=29523 RepID=UPI002620C214|nr:FISUMP domain-containing protein [Bacteroides sp.]MDD3040363.1 FISUMP domain-containing protein [Bacteroides sp.]
MKKNHFLSLLLIAVALCWGSCSNEKDAPGEKELIWKSQSFKINPLSIAVASQGMRASNEEETEIMSLNAYLFVNEILQKSIKNITLQNGSCTFDVVEGSTIYFLANLPETAELQAIETGKTKESTFRALHNKVTTDNKAVFFLSGSCQIPSISSNPKDLTVPMYRSVAQIDLDTSRDEKIKVTRIDIQDAATTSSLFPAESLSSSTGKQSYNLNYEDSPITSKENILRIYESNTPVKIMVYANYEDIPTVINLSIPQVKRNFKYTIRLTGVGTTITGKLQVVPWGDGGNIETLPDLSEKISLDKAFSILPEGVIIDSDHNQVSVSDKGGDITLAFASDIQVELESTEGTGNEVTVSSLGAESKEGKVISKFLVKVAKQGKGRLGYQVTLHMKRKLQQYSYDSFIIDVSQSVNQIAEVTIGGITWMAFNATTRDLEDQIYTLDGGTAEDMYKKSWPNTIGGLFQWGRIHMYAPCLSGNNNAGNQKQDIPWVSDTHIPCPKGYRLPTKAEMRALFPPQQEFPGEYIYNGEKITTTLHSSEPESVKIGSVSGKARYLRLKSETGAVLCFPLSGQKGDKSGAASPGLGQGFTIWSSENNGATGGWAWTGKFWPGSDKTSAVIENNSQLQAEGYAYVRCLKKKAQ